MQQPTQMPWRERLELVLEGGGKLPGAIRVVDIREKVLSCTAEREDDKAIVQGKLQVFIYYNLDGSDQVVGQGAEIPWSSEIPLPQSVRGPVDARVIEIRHDHSFDPLTEQLQHTMHVAFEVWAIDAPPLDHSYRKDPRQQDTDEPNPAPEMPPETRFHDTDDGQLPALSSAEDEGIGVSSATPVEVDPSDLDSLGEGFGPDESELQPTDVVVADTAIRERLEELDQSFRQLRTDLDAQMQELRTEINSLRNAIDMIDTKEADLRIEETIAELESLFRELAGLKTEQQEVPSTDVESQAQTNPQPKSVTSNPAKPSPQPRTAPPEISDQEEVIVWRPFPRS
jgi:hypothetical protein